MVGVGGGGGKFLIRAGGMRCKLVFDKRILIFLHISQVRILIFLHISQVLLVEVEVVKLRNKFLNFKKKMAFLKTGYFP